MSEHAPERGDKVLPIIIGFIERSTHHRPHGGGREDVHRVKEYGDRCSYRQRRAHYEHRHAKKFVCHLCFVLELNILVPWRGVAPRIRYLNRLSVPLSATACINTALPSQVTRSVTVPYTMNKTSKTHRRAAGWSRTTLSPSTVCTAAQFSVP